MGSLDVGLPRFSIPETTLLRQKMGTMSTSAATLDVMLLRFEKTASLKEISCSKVGYLCRYDLPLLQNASMPHGILISLARW